jgi:diguanylate cyclase (GGDEF)-like protein
MASVLRPFSITDLVSTAMLQDLADSLTALAEVPMWFATPDGQLLTRGESPFGACARVSRREGVGRPCLRCERDRLDGVGASWPAPRDLADALPCPTGLRDLVLPIRCEDRVVALLASGQFVTDEAALDRALGGLRANGVPEPEVRALARSVARLDPARLQALETAAQTIARVVVDLAAQAVCARRAAAEAERLAKTDPLTGVADRREAQRALEAARSLALRHRRPFGVLLCDIDDFKTINDCSGHPAGDQALVCFARAVESGIRPSDRLFRIGGDEFLVLCQEAGLSAVMELAERVRRTVAATPLYDGGRRVTTSIGVVAWEQGEVPSADDLVAAADVALYAAKAAGRNRVAAGPPRPASEAPRAHLH